MNVESAGPVSDIVEEFWDADTLEDRFRGGGESPDDFRDAFHQRFGRRGRVILTPSGRSALRILLQSLAASSTRRSVLLSSYNCRVVRDAVQGAGLACETFDFRSPLGQFDWETIGRRLGPQHLAIVVPHFFGIPADFTPLLPWARKAGVRIVEDCAHTLDATVAGTKAGLLGDAALFSFNYDKPISLAGGGALLIAADDIARDLAYREIRPPIAREYRQFRDLMATLRRARTLRGPPGYAARVGARLGLVPYAQPRLPEGIGALRAAMGMWQLAQYDSVREQRNRNAAALMPALGRIAWHVDATAVPAYLRLRVVTDRTSAERAVRLSLAHDIRLANSNWAVPIEAGDGASNPFAALAAARGLDVPVHQKLSGAQIATIADAFSGAAPAEGR